MALRVAVGLLVAFALVGPAAASYSIKIPVALNIVRIGNVDSTGHILHVTQHKSEPTLTAFTTSEVGKTTLNNQCAISFRNITPELFVFGSIGKAIWQPVTGPSGSGIDHKPIGLRTEAIACLIGFKYERVRIIRLGGIWNAKFVDEPYDSQSRLTPDIRIFDQNFNGETVFNGSFESHEIRSEPRAISLCCSPLGFLQSQCNKNQTDKSYYRSNAGYPIEPFRYRKLLSPIIAFRSAVLFIAGE